MKRLFLLTLFLLIPSLLFAGENIQLARSMPLIAGTVASSGGGGYQTPAFVQAKAVYSKSDPITMDSSVTSGNALFAILANMGDSIDGQSVTISGGCTGSWVGLTEVAEYTNRYSKVFYCLNAASGTNAVTLSNWSSGDGGWHLIEASGVASSSAYDTQGGAVTASETYFNSGNVTESIDGSFAIGVEFDSSDSSITWDTGWTNRSSLTGHYSFVATRVLGAAGSYAVSGTKTNTCNYASSIHIFKPRPN